MLADSVCPFTYLGGTGVGSPRERRDYGKGCGYASSFRPGDGTGCGYLGGRGKGNGRGYSFLQVCFLSAAGYDPFRAALLEANLFGSRT